MNDDAQLQRQVMQSNLSNFHRLFFTSTALEVDIFATVFGLAIFVYDGTVVC